MPNRYNQGPARRGQPSVIVAVALLGLVGYSHFAKQGMFDNFLGKKEVQQTATVNKPVKPRNPDYIMSLAEIKAYSNEELKQVVATVPVNTELKVLQVSRDSKGGIAWFKVKANGLTVWVKNIKVKRAD